MNSDEFVLLITQLIKKEQKNNFSLGTISSSHSSGRPKILFDGENTDSVKTYPYLSSYTPVANDRVLLVNIAGTHVVIGKII